MNSWQPVTKIGPACAFQFAMPSPMHKLLADKAMIEAPQNSKPDFYGAVIREAKLGPRKELALLIETWPKNKNTFGDGLKVTLRFDDISNYDEVQKFFENARADSLHYIRETPDSRENRRVTEFEFDRTGDHICITSRAVTVLNA
jgi:hypothetical protein